MLLHTPRGLIKTQEKRTVVFLPTYAPWTNPIEKLWRKLKQEVLHLHRYEDDWEGLKNRVACYLDSEQNYYTMLAYLNLENCTNCLLLSRLGYLIFKVH